MCADGTHQMTWNDGRRRVRCFTRVWQSALDTTKVKGIDREHGNRSQVLAFNQALTRPRHCGWHLAYSRLTASKCVVNISIQYRMPAERSMSGTCTWEGAIGLSHNVLRTRDVRWNTTNLLVQNAQCKTTKCRDPVGNNKIQIHNV